MWGTANLRKTMRASSWETRLGSLQAKPKYTSTGKREVLKNYFGSATRRGNKASSWY